MDSRRCLRALRRILVIAVGITAALALIAAASVVVISRDELAKLRAIEAVAKPVPPAVTRALLTTDPCLFDKRELSLRAFLPSTRKVARCAPTTALLVVRNVLPRTRPFRRHIETAIVTSVVTYAFTPEELLRIYAHDAYFGRVNGLPIYGIEAGSAAYFRKASRELTNAEAAMLIGMLPSPKTFSPFNDPARAIERRDRFLAQMLARGSIDEREFRAAVAQPIRE